jgi:hypothetical protein
MGVFKSQRSVRAYLSYLFRFRHVYESIWPNPSMKDINDVPLMQASYPAGFSVCEEWRKRRLHDDLIGEESISHVMCRYSLCHVYIHQSSEAPFGFIHLSTRLPPNFDSHVIKFVRLSLRSRQVYDHMLSIASIKSHSYFIAIRIDYCTLSSPSLHGM